MNPSMRSSSVYSDRIRLLRIKFVKTIIDRQERLNEISQAFAPMKLSVDQAIAVKYDVHKTAGTAGAFGYAELSKDAANTCSQLERLIAGESTSSEARRAFDYFMASLDKTLSTIKIQAPEHPHVSTIYPEDHRQV